MQQYDMPTETITFEQIIEEINNLDDKDYNLIVWNNDVNTYAEVITILVYALRCSAAQAIAKTIQIDKEGKAEVYSGTKVSCEEKAAIISSIGIKTTIEEK